MKNDKTLFKYVEKNYWDFYILLEKEFLICKKYIEFDNYNNSSYSFKFLMLLETICGEIDCVGKYMASLQNNKFNVKNSNILKWWFEIQNVFTYTFDNQNKYGSGLMNSYCYNYILDKEVKPWAGFKIIEETKNDSSAKSTIPSFWNAYTTIKHQRSLISNPSDKIINNYKNANLENTFNALTALYILVISLLMKIGNNDDIHSFKNNSEIFAKTRLINQSDIDEILYNS